MLLDKNCIPCLLALLVLCQLGCNGLPKSEAIAKLNETRYVDLSLGSQSDGVDLLDSQLSLNPHNARVAHSKDNSLVCFKRY